MSKTPPKVVPDAGRIHRAKHAAELALGEAVKLAVWTPIMQTFTGESGRVVHVWTYASEYRVELPRTSINALGKLVPTIPTPEVSP